ncbi:MAG: flagellar filament capping protein FliD [Syntrophobacteraceae bacterium]
MSSVTSTPSTSSTLTELGLTGMGTNIDWQSMLTQLQAVSEESLTPYTNQITTLNDQVSAWQTLDGDLSTLQTASNALTSSGTGLNIYSADVSSSSSVSASSLLSASASSTANNGSYQVVIGNTAQAEQLASQDFSSETSALNISGTIVVNGQGVEVAASDTLQDLESNINSANAGVTAAIIQDSPNTYRLVLTSGQTGAAGISLDDGSASNTLESLGFNGAGPTVIQNPVSGGAQGVEFSSTSTGIAALLGIASTSGTVTINGNSAIIDLSDTLQQIQQTLAGAGIAASIVPTTNGSQTTYSLNIAGMTSWTDNNNVLQTLGLTQGSRSDTVGVTASVANTGVVGVAGTVANTSGGSAITASTLISSIDGYDYTSGDEITISGTTHNGTTVGPTSLAITSTTTVGDLLTAIQNAFGNVTATVNSNGQIQVNDNTTGTSQLSVNLGTSIGASTGTLSFGSFQTNTAPITASTDITSIYGYNNYTSGDQIDISGTDHDGNAVAADFSITPTSTVGDLLTAIQNAFGNVTATVNSSGQIQVIDNASGTSKLSVNLDASLQASNAGQLDFGSFGQPATINQYVLQQGTNAAFTVDGMSMTSPTNTVTNAIAGVTLNLLGADPNTTLTVNVSPDAQAIEANINNWINAYNTVISYVNTQNTYTASSNTTGGPLFGDITMDTIKSELQSTIMNQVGTGSMDYLANVGITTGSNGQLSLDTITFGQALSSNFSGVADLFSDSGVCSSSQFQYVYSNSNTQSGTYNIDITQLPGTDQNIAGTIDGLAATGSGNVLALDNTASGADGLAVSFTGTSLPASATITVNRGIASLMNDLVSGFTNTSHGTVASQETGLNNTITGLNNQVNNLQSNINSQMTTLQTEFENMDVAVAQMDQMQSYLTDQLATL